ncbi:MAG: rhodanese-like domain-containing protein [Candidatus Methanoperedens sp.]|nr:rhodanese-like domain-containing protein [Candidatus Methanoperedens sp.]
MNRTLLILVLFFILSVALSGCIDNRKSEENKIADTTISEKNTFMNINVTQGKEMIDRGEVFILDVRRPDEYSNGHIRNSTLLAVQDIPAQDLETKLKELPKDSKILVYCRSGSRSVAASNILVNNGFSQVYNMQGGINGWISAGYETVQ